MRQPEPPTTTWSVAESTGKPAAATPDPTPLSEPSATPEEKPTAEAAAPESGQPPVAAASAPAEPERTPRQRVQAFLRDKGAPQAALELSRTMPESPDGRDAAFILQEVAAEGGLGQAMLSLARFYDPSDTAPAGTIQKDPEQAWIWYAKAAAAGEGEAAARIDGLKTWLTQDADKGSAKARELLARMR